jgi:hypothetical protein
MPLSFQKCQHQSKNALIIAKNSGVITKMPLSFKNVTIEKMPTLLQNAIVIATIPESLKMSFSLQKCQGQCNNDCDIAKW